ncbi:MAG TPA: Eco57I restriction-modification methylase domain-containing protein, partial [Ktedonobacterales bacterium]|nr:Eco57I restriction-modification methylase domain-containing protein [Ktedonobacterales bacterium]
MITDHAMAPVGATFGDLAHRTSAPEELLAQVDSMRLQAGKTLSLHQKAALGQFFTPVSLARLMASMLECLGQQVQLLDAGAGAGLLFAATVAELCPRPRTPKRISVTAYELDPELAILARQTLSACEAVCEQAGITFLGEVIEGDFLECAVTLLRGNLFSSQPPRPAFTCAILNPPYHKIHSQSCHRKLLRQIGVETSNLYTGFLAAATLLLEPQGELVAITPRSFCNGVYFRGFRRSLLKAMSLRRIHVFESREDAFHEDDVLQENVIISAANGVSRPTVTISSSAGPDDDMVLSHEVGYDRVVRSGDPQSFIHIVPDELGHRVVERLTAFPCSLRDLGLTVSTGRVVDFRARDFLRRHPDTGTAPLIYPTHCASGYVAWPKPDSRKPNALAIAARTRPQVVPNEHYVLVRRFSSKEEKKRVVAAVYD